MKATLVTNAPYGAHSVGAICLADVEVDIHGGVKSEGGDLLDDRAWAEDVQHALVDVHFKSVVRVGTITAWGATDGHLHVLGGDADGATDLVPLLLGSGKDIGASGLEGCHVPSAESHSDLLDFFLDFFSLRLVFVGVHFR